MNRFASLVIVAVFCFVSTTGFAKEIKPDVVFINADGDVVCVQQAADAMESAKKANRTSKVAAVATGTRASLINSHNNNKDEHAGFEERFDDQQRQINALTRSVDSRFQNVSGHLIRIDGRLTKAEREIKALNAKMTTGERKLASAISQQVAQRNIDLLGATTLQEKIHPGQKIFFIGFPRGSKEVKGLVKTQAIATMKTIQDNGLLVYLIEGTTSGSRIIDGQYATARSKNVFAFAEDNISANMKADCEIATVTAFAKGHGCYVKVHCEGDPSIVNTVNSQVATDVMMAKATVKAASQTLTSAKADLATANIKLVTAVLNRNMAKTAAETAEATFNSTASIVTSATALSAAQTKMLDTEKEYQVSESTLNGVQSDVRECEDDVTAVEEALEEAIKASEKAQAKKKRIARS